MHASRGHTVCGISILGVATGLEIMMAEQAIFLLWSPFWWFLPQNEMSLTSTLHTNNNDFYMYTWHSDLVHSILLGCFPTVS